jgi:hypothetical protein
VVEAVPKKQLPFFGAQLARSSAVNMDRLTAVKHDRIFSSDQLKAPGTFRVLHQIHQLNRHASPCNADAIP